MTPFTHVRIVHIDASENPVQVCSGTWAYWRLFEAMLHKIVSAENDTEESGSQAAFQSLSVKRLIRITTTRN